MQVSRRNLLRMTAAAAVGAILLKLKPIEMLFEEDVEYGIIHRMAPARITMKDFMEARAALQSQCPVPLEEKGSLQ